MAEFGSDGVGVSSALDESDIAEAEAESWKDCKPGSSKSLLNPTLPSAPVRSKRNKTFPSLSHALNQLERSVNNLPTRVKDRKKVSLSLHGIQNKNQVFGNPLVSKIYILQNRVIFKSSFSIYNVLNKYK